MVSTSTSEFPGFDELYIFRSTGSAREFVASIDLGHADHVAAIRGEMEVENARAQWAMGAKRPGSVVWTTLPGLALLSGDIVRELENANVSGWSVFPVELTSKDGQALGTYFGLVVAGRCGSLDLGRSIAGTKKYPGGTFPVLRGLFFNEGSWDGSDLFMPNDQTAFVFATARAKSAVSFAAKNVWFERLTDFERSPS